MIDLENGEVRISCDLKIYPEYSFDDFKKTKFYDGQDGIRIIYLKEQQVIDDKEYIVSLFFIDKKIYMISLINCDKELTEVEELKRKTIHDSILNQNGILNGNQYEWGKVLSEHDTRSNISSINIYYN